MAKRLVFPKAYFTRHPEQDFNDDGQYFRIVYYKDALPISATTYNDHYYVCIRLDYLRMSYETYRDDHTILDEFNGLHAKYFSMEKFIDNCEAMYQKYICNDPAPTSEDDHIGYKSYNIRITSTEITTIKKALSRRMTMLASQGRMNTPEYDQNFTLLKWFEDLPRVYDELTE